MLYKSLSIALLSATTLTAQAGFDRPTFGFDTTPLEPGQAVFEQSLPNFESGKKHYVEENSYSLDSVLRFGLLQNIELQLGLQLYGAQARNTEIKDVYDPETYTAPTNLETEQAFGDGTIGLKWVSDLGTKNVSMGFLFNTSLDFGDYPTTYSNKIRNYGTTIKWQLPHAMSLSLYANHQESGYGNGWQVAPNFGFPIYQNLAGYFELGFGERYEQLAVEFDNEFTPDKFHKRHRKDDTAGLGFIYGITSSLQLDLVIRAGIHSDTPDLQGGFGFSWAIPQ